EVARGRPGLGMAVGLPGLDRRPRPDDRPPGSLPPAPERDSAGGNEGVLNRGGLGVRSPADSAAPITPRNPNSR
ncbi:MAG: hypothetical protein R3282_00430, partial [Rhodothermales bacterium]|nr:hypothetical protein [Rhodothermales bacterium]